MIIILNVFVLCCFETLSLFWVAKIIKLQTEWGERVGMSGNFSNCFLTFSMIKKCFELPTKETV